MQGPVAHAVESFELEETDGFTRLDYGGELGVDLPLIASWYADRVVPIWKRAVLKSLEKVKKAPKIARERAGGARQEIRVVLRIQDGLDW